MKTAPCAMTSLVEANHDGRLGEREAASIARHLRTCAECTETAAQLASLRRLATERPEPATPIAHQRARLRLLREAAGVESASAPRPPRAFGVVLALTTLAATTALVLWLAVGGGWGRAPTPLASTASTPLPSDLHARTVTTVSPSPGARFSRDSGATTDVVQLDAGTLAIAVRKLAPGERFLVRTSDAEVEVRGTRFEVVASDQKLTSVTVQEGRVEVRWHGETRLLAPGDAWRPAPEASSSKTASAPPRAPAPARSADSSAAFRDGVKRMEQGDYGAAAERLRHYAETHPTDPRAEDAAFLAVLSLQRAGRPTEAAAAARRYLAAFPNGYRRAEAQTIANQATPER